MSRWIRTITTLGLNLLANVTDTRPINIVRMACASGVCDPDELISQTSLTSEVCDIPITASQQLSGNIYRVEGTLENTDIETGFTIRQVGVFATLGDSEDEVLFEIVQVSDAADGNYIPSAAESPGYCQVLDVDLVFSGAINITVEVDSGDVAALRTYVDEQDAKAKKNELLVAAFGSSSAWKMAADYICDGEDDIADIVTAINALPTGGGKIFLAPGAYQSKDSGSVSVSGKNVVIEGIGDAIIRTAGEIVELKGGAYVFKNITFYTDGAASSTFIKVYDSCDKVCVEDCEFATPSAGAWTSECFDVYEDEDTAQGHIAEYVIKGCEFVGKASALTDEKSIVRSYSDKARIMISGNKAGTLYYALYPSSPCLALCCEGNINIINRHYASSATISAGDKAEYVEISDFDFDTAKYSYSVDITNVTYSVSVAEDYVPITPHVSPSENIVGFSVHSAVGGDIEIEYRLVATPL